MQVKASFTRSTFLILLLFMHEKNNIEVKRYQIWSRVIDQSWITMFSNPPALTV